MKKFKLLVGAVALFAVVVVNVWNAATSLRGSELSVADVEAMANPEGIDGTDARKTHWVREHTATKRYNIITGKEDGEFYTWYCVKGGVCEKCKKGEHETLPYSNRPSERACDGHVKPVYHGPTTHGIYY